MSQPGVIAEMRCLKRQTFGTRTQTVHLTLAQYQHVFIKAAKSHNEQVIDANFNIILNEKKNGDEYYVSDNGQIRESNDHVDIVRYKDKAQRYNSD